MTNPHSFNLSLIAQERADLAPPVGRKLHEGLVGGAYGLGVFLALLFLITAISAYFISDHDAR